MEKSSLSRQTLQVRMLEIVELFIYQACSYSLYILQSNSFGQCLASEIAVQVFENWPQGNFNKSEIKNSSFQDYIFLVIIVIFKLFFF